MKEIKIYFSDFWPDLDFEDNFFTRLLRKKYNIKIDPNPDVLFYSYPGEKHKNYNSIKIFFTGEAQKPNFHDCDFAISFEPEESEKSIRFPLYNLYGEIEELLYPARPILKEENIPSKFCNMVVSNGLATKRIDFFHKLSQYKKVDSGGKFENNIGGPIPDKRNFIKDYKFTIAFENQSYRGYTTEKIIEPMFMNSVPLYWGNPHVHLDFSPRSFVNWNDYQDDDKMIERIIELDQDNQKYLEVLNAPKLPNNQINNFSDRERLLQFLSVVMDNLNWLSIARRRRDLLLLYFKTRAFLGRIKSKI